MSLPKLPDRVPDSLKQEHAQHITGRGIDQRASRGDHAVGINALRAPDAEDQVACISQRCLRILGLGDDLGSTGTRYLGEAVDLGAPATLGDKEEHVIGRNRSGAPVQAITGIDAERRCATAGKQVGESLRHGVGRAHAAHQNVPLTVEQEVHNVGEAVIELIR
jgi:hypothetical protein